MIVGILLIATNKYKRYVQPFLDSLDKHFLPTCHLRVYLFTDETQPYQFSERIGLIQSEIPPYKFPEATLLRYQIFTKRMYNECDYLYYSDVDMRFDMDVGMEILGNIVAVRHPGFYISGGGSWETREKSECYVSPEKRIKYYAGGFQGGLRSMYYAAMVIMRTMIEDDFISNIIPVWHDESAWNKYLSNLVGVKELTPSYCMVEEQSLREKWEIADLPAKIIALQKNHVEIRS